MPHTEQELVRRKLFQDVNTHYRSHTSTFIRLLKCFIESDTLAELWQALDTESVDLASALLTHRQSHNCLRVTAYVKHHDLEVPEKEFVLVRLGEKYELHNFRFKGIHDDSGSYLGNDIAAARRSLFNALPVRIESYQLNQYYSPVELDKLPDQLLQLSNDLDLITNVGTWVAPYTSSNAPCTDYSPAMIRTRVLLQQLYDQCYGNKRRPGQAGPTAELFNAGFNQQTLEQAITELGGEPNGK